MFQHRLLEVLAAGHSDVVSDDEAAFPDQGKAVFENVHIFILGKIDENDVKRTMILFLFH